MNETVSTSENITPELNSAIDGEWVSLIEGLTFESFSALTPSSSALTVQKERLLEAEETGNQYNPELIPEIDIAELQLFRHRLTEVRDIVRLRIEGLLAELTIPATSIPSDLPTPNLEGLQNLTEEQVRIVGHLYISKINAKLVEVNMVMAAANRDREMFMKCNNYLYGIPTMEMMEFGMQDIKAAIAKAEQSTDEYERSLAAQIKSMLPAMAGANSTDQLQQERPSEQEQFYEWMREKLIAEILADADPDVELDPSHKLSATEIKQLFDNFLARQFPGSDWQVEIYDGSLLNVRQSEKKVMIPENGGKKKFTALRIAQLIAHEGMKHVLSREKGTSPESKLQLLGVGLHNYDTGEEGAATTFEQAMTATEKEVSESTSQNIHLDRLLAICLASGVDRDYKPRTAQETFRIMHAYYNLIKYQEKGKADVAARIANNNAWIRVWRTYRGTNAADFYYAKDGAYAIGNGQVKGFIGDMVLQNRSNEEIFGMLTMGKWNIGDSFQYYYLVKLGILDDEEAIVAYNEAWEERLDVETKDEQKIDAFIQMLSDHYVIQNQVVGANIEEATRKFIEYKFKNHFEDTHFQRSAVTIKLAKLVENLRHKGLTLNKDFVLGVLKALV